MAVKKKQKPVGVVTHYYGDLGVAIVKFKVPVKTGETMQFKGVTTDFKEIIKSMQFNHKGIASAKKGQEVGVKVKKKVREGDEVWEVV
ncbi:MAG: translation elongation factor-like protein [Candidatus Colwellbacteria bacterium]|nr:translation elongation factor-like protein [Candidatus Colwellbacteria bacterium]